MQVNVVNGGDFGFNSLLYGNNQHAQRITEYIHQGFNRAVTVLGDMSSKFMDTTRSIYEKYNSSDAIRRAKLILNQAGTTMSDTVIYNVGRQHINNPGLLMQDYIMAQPTIYEMTNKQLIDGYSELYLNKEEDDPYYRSKYMEVADGLNDSSTINLLGRKNTDCVFYDASYLEKELDAFDKFSILDTYNTALNMISEGIDPTSENLDEL